MDVSFYNITRCGLACVAYSTWGQCESLMIGIGTEDWTLTPFLFPTLY